MSVTAEGLGAIAGILLTLTFSYIPGVREWFAKLTKEQQQLGMLLALALAALVIGAGGCLGWYGAVSCDANQWRDIAEALLMAIIANQSVYKLSPQAKSVRAAKAARGSD